MIPIGWIGIIGDQIYLQGLKEHNLSFIKVARFLFPFDRELVVSEALFLIRNNVVNKEAYQTLKEALIYDPYSVEMLGMYVQYANLFGTKDEANQSFKLLKKISPNSKMTNELSKYFKERD